jgi:hypothetical protein
MSSPERMTTDRDGIPTPGMSSDHVWQLHPELEPVAVNPDREELRQFLEMIGGLRSRTQRRYIALIPAAVRSRAGLVVTALAISAAAIGGRAWVNRPPSQLPAELQGAWNTSYRGYADRGFWIGKSSVAFQVGAEPAAVPVFAVKHLVVDRAHGDTTWYTITYAVDGGTSNWSIRHVNLPAPAIVFMHQSQMTWTRTSSRTAPAR